MESALDIVHDALPNVTFDAGADDGPALSTRLRKPSASRDFMAT